MNSTLTKTVIGFVVAPTLLLWVNCLQPTSADRAGTATETENVTAGVIYQPDGTTPAANAIVQFVRSDYVPGSGLSKTQAVTYSTVTSSTGRYSADSIPAGFYNVFASKAQDLAYAESIYVSSSTILPRDTLKAPGSLKGVVRLARGQDSRHVLILIFGTNSFASPSDSIGNFWLKDMAEGKYRVRLLAAGGGYSYRPMDTVFSIVAGHSNVLRDTIFLRMDSLDAPTGVTAKATGVSAQLCWKKNPEAIVYSVYRSTVDSGSYPYVGNTIDTFYNDTGTLNYGSRYYYKIKAANGMSGSPFSAPCSLWTVPAMPTSLTVIALGDSQIQVSWNPVSGALNYRILMQKSDGTYDSSNSTEQVIDTVKKVDYEDKNIFFSIKANNYGGSSTVSDVIAVWTIPDAPDSSLALVVLADSLIQASWHPVKNATKYRILIQRPDYSYDSTIFTKDTIDTIRGIDYHAPNVYILQAYNPAGLATSTNCKTASLGTITTSLPFYEDSGINLDEALGNLYIDSTNTPLYTGVGARIMIMTSNYIVDTVQIISDSTLYVSGKNVYNYSQLMFEIERFLKARYDSNITVTRSSGNRLLITNPLSSNLNIDHLSIDAGFATLFRGAIAIGHSGVTTSVRFRNLRPASSTGFLRSLLNSNKFGGTASFPDSTNGLEVGDVISINGQIGVASIQTVNSTCTRNTTIQDLLNLIRTAFNLPLYDGTPQNNLSVSIISNTLIMPGSGENIIAGSIVIRGRLGQANSISNVSINISNSDSDNVDPNYVFLSNLSFTEIQAARN